MKFAWRDNRSALSARRVILALGMASLLPILLHGSAPSWWSQRGVLVEEATADDYAPANQGQLKNIARAAVAEMDVKLTGGAGDELHALIASWSSSNPATNDFAPLNLGQVKNMAKPFYNRLIAAGLIDFYPWLRSATPSDDFAVANLGQVKNLFSFVIPLSNSLDDALSSRVAAGQRSGNLAVEANAVWFWGNRFGADSNFQSTYPKRLPALSAITSVSAGDDHLVARAANGTILTWGKNSRGQLGDGTNVDRATPTVIPNMANVSSIKASGVHTMVLKQDGTVFAWGENYYGELGTGDNVSSAVPIQVVGLSDVRKIAAGPTRSVALKNDGTVWTWGYDHYDWQTGQEISTNLPSQVAALTEVVDVAAGYEHVIAVKADGSVWAWGSNYANQIGNGNQWWKFQDVPTQVPNLANVTKVASNFDHSLALQSDGTVWAWGFNAFGQLGDGTTEARQSPIQVTALTNVVAIATTYQYSLAMKADGTVWTWGDGSSGTLPGVDLRVPQQVGLGVFDTNHNGMDDRWEMEYLGGLDQPVDADADGDGLSNSQEFFRGTDPRDYFNGATAVIEIVSGNNQLGDPGTLLPKPVTVRIKNASGQFLANAPVHFKVTSGGALVTARPGEPLQGVLVVRSDGAGQASAYVRLPVAPGVGARIAASPAGADSSATAAGVSLRASSRFTPPATPTMPTPSPDPNASPAPSATPLPSPTATPPPPYRYAILDLGSDLYPLRINNKGGILVAGADSQGNWSYYRWKGGALERLTYADPNLRFQAMDINDGGVVVGKIDDTQTERSAGIVWLSDKTSGQKVPGNLVPDGTGNASGNTRHASFSAVTNADTIYGETATGGRFVGIEIGVQIPFGLIQNSARWSTDGIMLQILSNGAPIQVVGGHDNWTGRLDTIRSANSAGEYIGRSLVASSDLLLFGGSKVNLCTSTEMISGQPVSFRPVDLNEAGMVAGSAGDNMVVRSSSNAQITITGASPLAINDHTKPAPSPKPSPSANPAPTPIPAPQIIAWAGDALAIWELQEDGRTWHPFGLEEMIPSMDGWQYLEPYDMNDHGAIVGRGWYTDPSIPGAQGEYHAFLLVPVELVPDFERNGIIDGKDSGRVTETEPWRFWINDDDDAGALGGDDIPGLTDSDAKDAGLGTFRVDGVRDLVDFFPLYLDLRHIVALLPPTQFSYFLKQEQGAVNFAYTDLKPGGGRDERAGAYLKDLDAAQQLRDAEAFQITAAGIPLTTAFLNKINDDGKGVILIEGRSPTDKPLVLEVRKGNKKIMEIGFHVKIDGVEQMFRHKNLLAPGGGSGGPEDRLGEPANYPDYVPTNKSFVMVHGYNVNPESARGWGAEIFKRLYWTGSNAKFYNVTWYGSETQIGGSLTTDYQANVANAFATAQQFASFIGGLSNVTVAAHSLGNMLVGSAIHDWEARPSNYFMIDAAVAKECYDETEKQLSNGTVIGMEHPEWSVYDRRLWASNWHLLFPAGDNRQTLTWANRLQNIESVPAHNFYSTGEEVLKNPGSSPSLPLSTEEVWNNQERMKGRMLTGQVLSSNYGGWAFSNYWDIADTNVKPDLVYRRRFPNETSAIIDAQLRTNPFFRPGPAELYGTNGSNYASPQQRRNTLLAEMIPALSFAAGSNRLESFGDEGNFDMPSIFAEGWPPERGGNTKWFHSDVKIVAYTYIYKLYEQFVVIGGLDQ